MARIIHVHVCVIPSIGFYFTIHSCVLLRPLLKEMKGRAGFFDRSGLEERSLSPSDRSTERSARWTWCGVVCVGGVAYVVGGVITSSLRSDSDGWIDTYVSDRDGLDRTCLLARESRQ